MDNANVDLISDYTLKLLGRCAMLQFVLLLSMSPCIGIDRGINRTQTRNASTAYFYICKDPTFVRAVTGPGHCRYFAYSPLYITCTCIHEGNLVTMQQKNQRRGHGRRDQSVEEIQSGILLRSGQ